jgi:hypothetical protein
MDFTDKRLAEKFAAFEKEHDLTLVYEALDTIEESERDVPAGDAAGRQRAVSRWLRFFAALDRNIDPKWDPNDVAAQGVTLPLTHGVVYPSGEVDAATIPDPVERAQYEHALQSDEEARKQYGIQLQLRRIDERAMRFVERLLVERYTNSEGDRQEFEGLLATSPADEPRKERLRALMINRRNL